MRKPLRVFLILVSVLNGLAGLITGALFIISPDGSLMGFEPLVSVVKTLPLASIFFRNLMWIGIAMILVLGIPNALASVMLIRQSNRQYVVTIAAGVLLMLWTGFELIFMYNVAAVGYFVVGVVSIACSLLLQRDTRANASTKGARP